MLGRYFGRALTIAAPPTGASVGGLLKIANEIKLDHDNVRDLYERFKVARTHDERGVIANTLIREMAVHSDAEEISVYNDYEKLGLGDEATHNREEHAEVKRLVYAADAAPIDHRDYTNIMGQAVTAFLTHAEEEENDQLIKLTQRLSHEDNNVLARAFLQARQAVPTRPHPLAPQTGGLAQKAAGVQGRLHDKIIETLGRRKFTDLKYEHPKV